MLGSKLTELRFTPPFIPMAKLWRGSCSWARTGSPTNKHNMLSNAITDCFFMYLFEIKFNQFVIFCEMYKEYFTVDEPSPVIDAFEAESGLYRSYLYAV